MFEDFYTSMNELKSSIDGILAQTIEDKADASIDTLAKITLRELLVQLGMEAINAVADFQYEPYKDLLELNLSNPRHVKVEGGTIVTAFNEEVAGTWFDLIQGMIAAGGHTGSEIAPIIWHFGIYGPWAGTGSPPKWMDKLDLPSYTDVIDQRIQYWEGNSHVAPYWMIINYGTTAFEDSERAYPQVVGQHFVEKFRSLAPAVVERAKLVYIQNMLASYGAEVDEILANPKRGTTINILRVPVDEGTLRVQESAAGNIFFKIGNRGLTFNEAKAMIRRAYG